MRIAKGEGRDDDGGMKKKKPPLYISGLAKFGSGLGGNFIEWVVVLAESCGPQFSFYGNLVECHRTSRGSSLASEGG